MKRDNIQRRIIKDRIPLAAIYLMGLIVVALQLRSLL